MNHIGILESTFVWLGGYAPSSLTGDSRQDREPVTKLGTTVAFATIVAAINWAIGGWTYAAGLAGPHRWLATIVTALMGMFLVLVFDRGLVYVIDTVGKVGRVRLAVFTAFRFAIVVAISSLTSQAVIPLLLGPELKITALKMQERSERERSTALRDQFQIDTKEQARDGAAKAVDRLAAAALTLPADISARLASAQRCWVQHAASRRALVDGGMTPEDARERMRPRASSCSLAEREAKADQAGYVQRVRQQLDQATEHQLSARQALDSAQGTLTRRVDEAREIELANFNATSSAVLWELLRSNPAAMGKWALITLVLLVCELLPLIFKLQMGQTLPGRRIATENRMKQRQLESELIQHEYSLGLHDEIGQASHEGMLSAMDQPEVRKVFTDCFASTLKTMAPSEAVSSMMRELKSRGPDVAAFQRRHPQYAQVVGQAWRNAIAQTLVTLAASAPRGAANRPSAAAAGP